MPAPLRMGAGALLVLLPILLSSSASAQVPAPPDALASNTFAMAIQCDRTALSPSYAGQDEVQCSVQDLSRDAAYAPGSTSGGTGATPHFVTLTTRPANNSLGVKGYQVLVTRYQIQLYGGNTEFFAVNVKATPQVNAQDYSFELVANFTQSTTGYTQTTIVPFNAQVGRYDFALLSWSGSQAQKAGQDDVVQYSLEVANTGVYPDSYRFSIHAPLDAGLQITTPSDVYVPAGEKRVVNFSVLTPHDKIIELGKTVPIGVKINSMGFGGQGGSGVYSTTAILQIAGPYIPIYWIPLLVVGVVSATVVVRGASERGERRRLERGAPRRVELSPRQAILLAELKRSDPAAYKEKKAAIDAVYAERRQEHRAHSKERAVRDREEARVAKAEFVAQKAKRREEAKAAKRQAILDRRAKRLEDKELRAKSKELEKRKKALGKAKAKQEKIDAKLAAKAAAKQAKLDAKAAKEQAAADKKAAREAKKAAKQKKP